MKITGHGHIPEKITPTQMQNQQGVEKQKFDKHIEQKQQAEQARQIEMNNRIHTEFVQGLKQISDKIGIHGDVSGETIHEGCRAGT